MDLVHPSQLPFLPLSFVDGGVHEVYPFLPAVYLCPVEAFLSEFLNDPFPFFGGELGVEGLK